MSGMGSAGVLGRKRNGLAGKASQHPLFFSSPSAADVIHTVSFSSLLL